MTSSASTTAAVAIATAVAAVALSASVYWRTSMRAAARIEELEASLEASRKKAAAERRGRTRAQQALRKALLAQQQSPSSAATTTTSYPLTPIGVVQSCFSTRNGTPRQPLLVPLARACLVLDPNQAPAEALEGLSDYSHCWILYVFHLNTDLDKLWKQPSRSKFKAKVRVPRLRGGKMGVLATRSPHRPCPIGLTVAKVEAVNGCVVLLSGVDLVDGTPVLDVKPYLPYSDCIQTAAIPKWLEGNNSLAVASVSFSSVFQASLSDCWVTAGKHSMYASLDELQDLIKQALSWDIRSVSQQCRPHSTAYRDANLVLDCEELGDDIDHNHHDTDCSGTSQTSGDVTYHLVLEGVDISYKIDTNSNVMVEKATPSSDCGTNRRDKAGYIAWRDNLGSLP